MSSCECPICLDDIDVSKNCTRTECGHTFHATCLMNNILRNGFGCPYCRTAMVEEPEEEDDESQFSRGDEDEVDDEEIEDYTLRGFRFFFENVEGIAHEDEDTLEEYEEQRRSNPSTPLAKPTPVFIAQKLTEQGITMESLVKMLLVEHDEYDDEEEEFEDVGEDIFGRMRIIISNYQN